MKTFIVLLAVALVCAQAAGGWKKLDNSEVENSDVLRNLLDFGRQEFIKKAIKENRITDSKLTVSKIESVSQQVVAGMNIEYNVQMADSQGKTLFVTMIVFYQPWTGIKELSSYKISEMPQLTAGGWKKVDVKEVETNASLKSLLDFARQEFVKKASQDNQITDSNLKVSKINSVSQQVVAGTNTEFNVDLVDSQGNTVTTTMVVFYQPWSGIKQLTSYKIKKSQEAVQKAGGWKKVNNKDVETSESLKSQLEFGRQEVIKAAIKENRITDSNLKVSKINSISQQVVSGTNTEFNVDLSDSQGNTVSVTFVVYDQPWTQTRELTSYKINHTSQETTQLAGGWKKVDIKGAENDDYIKGLFNFARQEFIKTASKKDPITGANLKVGKITSISQQVVSGTNTEFKVDFDNTLGTTTPVTLVVYDQPWTGTRELVSYKIGA